MDKPLNREEFDRLVYLMDEEVNATVFLHGVSLLHESLSEEALIPELITLYNEHKLAGGGFRGAYGCRQHGAFKEAGKLYRVQELVRRCALSR